MGVLLAGAIASSALGAAYSEHLKQQQLINNMSPETRALFLKRQAELQAEEQAAYIKGLNECRLQMMKTEVEYEARKRQRDLSLKYEQESRKLYPHAWALSDWVDDVLKMLDEESQFNPIPRLMNNN